MRREVIAMFYIFACGGNTFSSSTVVLEILKHRYTDWLCSRLSPCLHLLIHFELTPWKHDPPEMLV